MRQITKNSAQAFIEGREFSNSNTKVMGNSTNAVLTLFDNVIATKENDNYLITDSGWKTVTTKERLNGILDALQSKWRIYQLNKKWYITDGMGTRQEWTGVLEVKD